jgi:hypothetical protein
MYTITEKTTNKVFPNLYGVFKRCFPIAMNNAKVYGNAIVSYYDEVYIIKYEENV